MDPLVGSYLRSLGYLVGLLGLAYGSVRAARAVHPGGDAIERLARALAVAFGFVIVVGLVLGVCRGLNGAAFLAASFAFAAVGHRLAPAGAGGACSDIEAGAADHGPEHDAPAATLATSWPLILPLLAFLPHWARSMASPPRAWDALTYHLPRAVAWFQDGGFRFRPMPDAGRYYAFFPPGGDLVFAHTFLAGHADALLFVAYAATMAFVVTSTYALARSMGAQPRSASVAGALVGTLPCVVQASASAYVDATALGLFCACIASVVRGTASRFVARELLLAAVLGGAAAVTKSTGYALVAFVLAALLHARVRGRASPAQVATGVLLALLPIALWVGYTYAHTGSPTYPFALRIAGHEVFAGNELLRVTLDGSTGFGREVDSSFGAFFLELFVGTRARGFPHLNLGLGGGAAILVGIGSAAFVRRIPRALLVMLVVLSVLPLLAMLTPSTVIMRSLWSPVSGRLVMSMVAMAACVAASANRGASTAGLALGIALGLPTAMPAGLPLRDLELGWIAIGVGALWCLTVGLAMARVTVPGLQSRRVALLVLGACLVSPTLLSMLAEARDLTRHAYYAALARRGSFDFHPVKVRDLPALWRALDGAEPRGIAFSNGFAMLGHTWFVYPLYGGRFQNRVEYVSATVDGSVVDTWRPSSTPLDAAAFHARALRAGLDTVVFTPPAPPEYTVVASDRARFRARMACPDRGCVVFEIRR